MSIDAALLAFGASLLAAHRGPAQMLVSHLAEQLGRSFGLLFVALLATLVTSALAAFAGAWISSQFIGFERAIIAAIAMALAAARVSGRRQGPLPVEPTRSFGAIGLALVAMQLVDPPRLVIFASAALLAIPTFALAGGGAALVLSAVLGWSLAAQTKHFAAWPWLRLAIASLLALLALLIVLSGYMATH